MASKSIKFDFYYEVVSRSCCTEYGKIHRKPTAIGSIFVELHSNRLHVRRFAMNSWKLGSQKLKTFFCRTPAGDCLHVFKLEALSLYNSNDEIFEKLDHPNFS